MNSYTVSKESLMLPLYKTTGRFGAIIGFCAGIPVAALCLLCISLLEPDPPPTLLFFAIFVVGFSLYTLVTGAVTALCTCCLVLRAQKSQLWKRLLIGDAGILFVRWLEARGHNRQTILGSLIGARTGCIVGAVLTAATLIILAILTDCLRYPMIEIWIWGATYLMGAVCALHGLPIGSMVVKELERLKPPE